MSLKTGAALQLPARSPQRHRFDVRLRHLTVKRREMISASMVRITLEGAELQGFRSLGFDDHVKMFFAEDSASKPLLPRVGPNGLEMPEGDAKPIARDYTPRRYDEEGGELDIDFVLGHDGPASNWAGQAKPGDSAWIAGPRGSFVVPFEFDWHLLIADETGLPALARRLAEFPADQSVVAIVETGSKKDRITLDSRANTTTIWVYRDEAQSSDTPVLLEALCKQTLPIGDFYSWVACESASAKTLRNYLVAECGANPKWIRASGYWRRGANGVHDHFED